MKNVLLLLCAFLGLSGCHAAQDGDTIDNSTVSVFDVRRFMGNGMKLLVTIIVSKRNDTCRCYLFFTGKWKH